MAPGSSSLSNLFACPLSFVIIVTSLEYLSFFDGETGVREGGNSARPNRLPWETFHARLRRACDR